MISQKNINDIKREFNFEGSGYSAVDVLSLAQQAELIDVLKQMNKKLEKINATLAAKKEQH